MAQPRISPSGPLEPVPGPETTDTVVNVSAVPGASCSNALDYLLANKINTSLIATTYQGGVTTGTGEAALTDVAQIFPMAPFSGFADYHPSPDWETDGNLMRCLRAGTWDIQVSFSPTKTTAAQAIYLLIGSAALSGVSIFNPIFPIALHTVSVNIPLAISLRRVLTLAAGAEIALLAQRSTVAAGNLRTGGPVVWTIRPAGGIL